MAVLYQGAMFKVWLSFNQVHPQNVKKINFFIINNLGSLILKDSKA